METLTMKKSLETFILAGILVAAAIPGMVKANCGDTTCSQNECCSKYGYCGTDFDWCGPNCRGGPCFDNHFDIASIVTPDFFNGILDKAAATCSGKNFYTRDKFFGALSSFPLFAKARSFDDSKREIAAFFAHASHETGSFCFIEEKDGASKDYCNVSRTDYPCKSGKGYYGRGPLQLTWNYNYGEAGKEVGFDGLGTPEIVADDSVISFKASLSYWMNNVAEAMYKEGFGATIKAINSIECGNPANARIDLYKEYCQKFSVDPGTGNLSC